MSYNSYNVNKILMCSLLEDAYFLFRIQKYKQINQTISCYLSISYIAFGITWKVVQVIPNVPLLICCYLRLIAIYENEKT